MSISDQDYQEAYDKWFYGNLENLGYKDLIWTAGNVDLKLVDGSQNREVQLNSLINIFGVSGLEIPFLKEGSIEKVYDAGYKTAPQIIKAPLNVLQSILGESAGSKVYECIRGKLNPVPLYIIAASSSKLGRRIGRRRIKRLLEEVPIENWNLENIKKVDGFEQITAQTIVDNLPKFYDFLEQIEGYYVLEEPKAKIEGGSLAGQSFVFTGYRDKLAQSAIEDKGGTIGNGVSKTTNYLVTKDPYSTSSKITKARDLGIKVIGPDELNALLK